MCDSAVCFIRKKTLRFDKCVNYIVTAYFDESKDIKPPVLPGIKFFMESVEKFSKYDKKTN